MKKLLITGFEPFGGESINPSWEAVKRLPDEIKDYSLSKMQIPVSFKESAKRVIKAAEDISADVILCIGQAGGRDNITPELVGINLRHSTAADNNGYQPKDEPIIPGGQAAFFSTLPVRKMSEAINALGIPAKVSYSAGAYVCNDVIYTLLAYFDGTKTRVGFIHIPYCPEQNKNPTMDINDAVRGVICAIESIDERKS